MQLSDPDLVAQAREMRERGERHISEYNIVMLGNAWLRKERDVYDGMKDVLTHRDDLDEQTRRDIIRHITEPFERVAENMKYLEECRTEELS